MTLPELLIFVMSPQCTCVTVIESLLLVKLLHSTQKYNIMYLSCMNIILKN